MPHFNYEGYNASNGYLYNNLEYIIIDYEDGSNKLIIKEEIPLIWHR